MHRARLPLTLAAAGASLAVLAGCSSASLIEPHIADNGVEYEVARVGEPVAVEGTATTDAITLCMLGVTATNKSGEDMLAGEAQGSTYGTIDSESLDIFSNSAEGKNYNGWPVPTKEWRFGDLPDGDSVEWIINKECDDTTSTVSVRLGDKDVEVPVS